MLVSIILFHIVLSNDAFMLNLILKGVLAMSDTYLTTVELSTRIKYEAAPSASV